MTKLNTLKYFFTGLLLVFIYSSCVKDDVIMDLEPQMFDGETFNTTLLIDGHEFDGAIIRNCIFENITGDGLQISDVDNLCIENCIFRNISENAIRFSISGTSNGVKIIDNEIYNIEENGILAPENHINTLIQKNLIYNVATNIIPSQPGEPHHGIYFQGFNVSIKGNTIYDIINNQGNCISIRSYGIISNNKLYNASEHGISYYSDHPGDSEELLIENNIIYDNGKSGVNLASNGNSDNHIGKAIIRFNTIVSNFYSTIFISEGFSELSFDIVANVVIKTDGGSTIAFSSQPYNLYYNVDGSGDIGFVDYENRDLHITSSSSATNAATGSIDISSFDFPAIDFDGDIRSFSNMDAGADEI